jgi:uncharacterized protein YdhG (YjbR/CyaY superfamily)
MPATVENYIASQPPDVALILERLREIIRKAAPEAEEKLKYGMPGFFIGKEHIVYLAGWKKHVGLYPVYPQAAALEAKLAPYRAEKDTLQLKYSAPIPYDLVDKLVRARVKQLRARA